MGGHGGLNILPQKKWNVYNFDNREKVRKDEEEAAKEEQLKREQSRRRDSEFRLQTLRQIRHVSATKPSSSSSSNHINLFESLQDDIEDKNKKDAKKEEEERGDDKKRGKRKREDKPPVITPEDEKYKLGYGLVGKGVKVPWYASMPSVSAAFDMREEKKDGSNARSGDGKSKNNDNKKKSIAELREERMQRERKEREREAGLLWSKEKGFSRRRM